MCGLGVTAPRPLGLKCSGIGGAYAPVRHQTLKSQPKTLTLNLKARNATFWEIAVTSIILLH